MLSNVFFWGVKGLKCGIFLWNYPCWVKLQQSPAAFFWRVHYLEWNSPLKIGWFFTRKFWGVFDRTMGTEMRKSQKTVASRDPSFQKDLASRTEKRPIHTVDGNQKSGDRSPVEGLVVYPIIYGVWHIPVVSRISFWTINSIESLKVVPTQQQGLFCFFKSNP